LQSGHAKAFQPFGYISLKILQRMRQPPRFRTDGDFPQLAIESARTVEIYGNKREFDNSPGKRNNGAAARCISQDFTSILADREQRRPSRRWRRSPDEVQAAPFRGVAALTRGSRRSGSQYVTGRSTRPCGRYGGL